MASSNVMLDSLAWQHGDKRLHLDNLAGVYRLGLCIWIDFIPQHKSLTFSKTVTDMDFDDNCIDNIDKYANILNAFVFILLKTLHYHFYLY